MRSQPHIHSGNESSTPHLHALEHKVDKRSRAPTHVLFQVSKMAGVMVSVATGVMTSVVEKLTILLGGEFNLASDVRRGIRFMKDELCSMNAALQRLADVDDDQIDVQTIQWRSKVRELSYDIEDCVDRFMLLHGCDKAKKNFVKSTLRKIFPLWGDRQIAKEIQDLKARIIEEKERRDRYNVDQYINDMHQRVCLDPRAPTLYEEARDLVGIHGPREEIIGWLKDEERQLKVVSIFGIGGQGKTTLAMEAYRKTQEPFDCRASVTVSRALDINKLLRDILFQINRGEYDRSERWDMEQLIPTLREYLMDKRYLIVIDDIWSALDWEYVKSALPTNNNRSRIITTTRIKDVAQSCCAGGGHIYEAKPLSEEHSSRLFFRRIFCSLEECPHELREVANDILRKCAGLPLAIISIAGLLANKSRTVDVWTKVRNSVSCAAEKDSLVDKMKRILFFSYFDLPHYLKTCLLYLSIFPEDYTIDCRDLVRRWVAEGLIPGRSRESMELLGECYLHELINRSMVQPTKLGVDGTTVKVCRVHDLVLDFIISQSVEDNFVAILNANVFHGNFSNKIRRLCLQSNFPEASDVAKAVVNNISHLRSFYLIISDQEELGTQVSHLLNGQVLQVLSIEGASTWGDHPERIGNFSRLKYLNIGEMVISKIPEEIGNLQHLEILDVRENWRIRELPASIVQLHKLVCLFIHKEVKLPSGIGNLQALEELSSVGLHRASVECIHELGRLTKLKALEILGVARDVEGRREACISSLSKLVTRSLRSLQFTGGFGSGFMNSWIVSCGSTTAQLRKLVLNVKFDFIPSRIGSLVNLTRLNFGVRGEVGEEGIKTLASLPVLLSLTVSLHTDFSGVIHPKHVIGRQGFQHLLKFNFNCQYDGALEFEAGAMPKLQSLKLKLQARFQFKYGNGGLLVGLPYLLGLKHIAVVNNCTNAVTEEVDTLENGIRDAAKTLPNYPVCEITREDQ